MYGGRPSVRQRQQQAEEAEEAEEAEREEYEQWERQQAEDARRRSEWARADASPLAAIDGT